MQKPIVQVVPIIDTEGPTTGRSDLFDNWHSLGEAAKSLTTEARNRFRDSLGGPAKFSWFVVDWAGYSSGDPEFRRRGHDNRLHTIWNFYRKNILTDSHLEESGDGLYWHYHHPPKDGAWGWNGDWHDSSWHEYIIAKRMLDFRFFPAVYRAGKYVENNASSQWLERWIPFDFSGIAPVKREFCDWSRAPVDWQPYHPSADDYQRPGAMKRLIARSLPVAAKGGSGNLAEEEVAHAFQEAKEKGAALFSFHTHDYYKSIFDDFAAAAAMVEKTSRAFNVPWKFANALDAIREYAEVAPRNFSFRLTRNGDRIIITSSHAVFDDMPFVAVEYANGDVRRVDAERQDAGWVLAIPDSAVRLSVGGADRYGNTDVKVISN